MKSYITVIFCFSKGSVIRKLHKNSSILHTEINILKSMDRIYTKEKYILLDNLFILKLPFIIAKLFPLNPKQFQNTSPQHPLQCLKVQ